MFNNLVEQLANPQWQSVAFWFFIFIVLVIVSSVIETIYRSRTPQSAVAWVMALTFIPIFGLLTYLLFGRRKFKGYTRARDFKTNEISDLALRTIEAIYPSISNQSAPLETIEKVLEMPFVKGNDLQLLINAQDTYEAIFKAIDDAQDYILLAYYIVRDDKVGQQLRERLEKKAVEGIKVYFIYDEVGSWQLAENYIQALKNAGVHIQSFNTTKGFWNRFQINFRNHRKLVIVDGYIAFAGGINIGEEYLGNKKRLSPWRDTHIQVKGPGALCAQLVFLEDWYWSSNTIPQFTWNRAEPQPANKEILLMATGPADKNLEACTQTYSYLISRAKKRVWITTPYFIPNQIILNSLHVAALSGVDVRILIPQKADGILVKLSSFSFMLEALGYGVKLWSYPGFLHQKVLLIDDMLTSIGSVNLDNRSFRLNFEANVIVRDKPFTQRVAEMLNADFALSKAFELDVEKKRNVIFKFITKAARLLAPLQ